MNEYAIKCPYCGEVLHLQFQEKIKVNSKILCVYCKRKFSFNKKYLKREPNIFQTNKMLLWFKDFFSDNGFGFWLAIILLVIFVVFWISEFRNGIIWIPISF